MLFIATVGHQIDVVWKYHAVRVLWLPFRYETAGKFVRTTARALMVVQRWSSC